MSDDGAVEARDRQRLAWDGDDVAFAVNHERRDDDDPCVVDTANASLDLRRHEPRLPFRRDGVLDDGLRAD